MKHLVLTCGDPGGIGPEVILKALLEVGKKKSFKATLVGGECIFDDPYYLKWLQPIEKLFGSKFDKVKSSTDTIKKGTASASNGRLSVQWIEEAVRLVQEIQCSGLVTGPICKEALMMAGITYKGHTDLLESLTRSSQVTMGFVTPQFSVALATIHIPLAEVPKQLNETGLIQTIRHACKLSRRMGHSEPKVAVLGLNPHAGENGALGTEEVWIRKVIDTMRQAEPGISGPYPPDTLFLRVLKGEFDTVVSLYHDQGLIPVKLLHFDEAVNVTIGLPFWRTSPDHGTAFDIAFMNQANPSSTCHAIQFLLEGPS